MSFERVLESASNEHTTRFYLKHLQEVRENPPPENIGRDPVVGELLSLSTSEVVIRRNDPQVGEVAVHFPRAGFIIQPAG